MVTRDKEIFDAKVAEVNGIPMHDQVINLSKDCFVMAEEGATDRILVELETVAGTDDLISQLKKSLDSVECFCKCDVILHMVVQDLTMKDLYRIDRTVETSRLRTNDFFFGVAQDKTFEKGHHKLRLFIYAKELFS